MYHLDLFSGIGGFALACDWAGIETIGFVEIDKYCQKVLRKHWPNVPIVEDIRDVQAIKAIVDDPAGRAMWNDGKDIGEAIGNVNTPSGSGILCRTGRLSGATKLQTPAILITAGFPCQPFSVAGKRGGDTDDRYLWPETLAVIKAIKPAWVLLENVAGIIPMALDTVLSDLEGAGYSRETLVIPACAVNAWHRRDRVWIVANNGKLGLPTRASQRIQPQEQKPKGQESYNICSEDVADTKQLRCEGNRRLADGQRVGQEQEGTYPTESDWWAVEPQLGRVAHGIPNRVDRLKCLGNAIVPQVAYEIIKVIKELE